MHKINMFRSYFLSHFPRTWRLGIGIEIILTQCDGNALTYIGSIGVKRDSIQFHCIHPIRTPTPSSLFAENLSVEESAYERDA